MRLPVSRARYDLLEHNMRELVTILRSSLAVSDARALAAEAQRDSLLERLIDPATPAPVVTTSTNGTTGHADLQPRPRSLVAKAIKDEAQGDPRLASYMVKRAKELRDEGKTPEEIALALGTWVSTEDDGREATAGATV